VQALLTTGQQRSSRTPGVATARELGFPELEAASWSGIVVPLAASDAVINFWNQEIRRALATKSVLEEYHNLEIHVNPGTPGDFSKFMSREIQRWQQMIARSGINLMF
jgi:tripartite-type tricarboxylate transporter receptor subunit TctC